MKKSVFQQDNEIRDEYKAEGKLALWYEEMREIEQYFGALHEMATMDTRFISNFKTFHGWNHEQRLWWIDNIKDQAERGLDTVGVLVVSKVIEMRLTTE